MVLLMSIGYLDVVAPIPTRKEINENIERA